MSSSLTCTVPFSSLSKRRYSSRPFYTALLFLTILASLSWAFGSLPDGLTTPSYHVRRQARFDTIAFGQDGGEAEVIVHT